jgi:hypothetical protein
LKEAPQFSQFTRMGFAFPTAGKRAAADTGSIPAR